MGFRAYLQRIKTAALALALALVAQDAATYSHPASQDSEPIEVGCTLEWVGTSRKPVVICRPADCGLEWTFPMICI